MLIFNKNILTIGGNRLEGGPLTPPTPPGPPVLPPNTVRVRTNDGNVPNKSMGASYETATLVSGTSDVYDVYKSGTDFKDFLSDSTNVVEVLGANTTDITIMRGMFSGCTSLSTVPLFDTSNATSMFAMFNGCTSLTNIPLFDTSKVSTMRNMFQNCYNVQSGALALYQQASSQANPPSNHSGTFRQCGRDTQTGSAELAQIPSDWKE